MADWFQENAPAQKDWFASNAPIPTLQAQVVTPSEGGGNDLLFYKSGQTQPQREELNAPLREAMQVPAVKELLLRDGTIPASTARDWGLDLYRASLGPSELFSKEKFIFVYADVRGRYMSGGQPTQLKPHAPDKAANATDEMLAASGVETWNEAP
jgi:predicted acyl esterase